MVEKLYAAMYEAIAAHSRRAINVAAETTHHDYYSRPLGILAGCARLVVDLPVAPLNRSCDGRTRIGPTSLLVVAEKITSMAEKQRIEAITLPVADVDRAKAFYERAGWNLDFDTDPAPGMRVVQFTPPGSACSITFGTGMPQAEPGSYRNTYLAVSDIARAHAELIERGIEVSDIYHWTQEGRTPGVDPNRADFGLYPEFADPDGRTPGVDPNRADFGSYAEFADPDGNTWLVQEAPSRASTEV